MATVVGSPDVDQIRKSAAKLGPVIGNVGSEIGQRTIRSLDRTIDIVAKFGRTEQCQGPRLPVIGRRLPLGWLQDARINEPALLQLGETFVDRPLLDQRPLGSEHIMVYAEGGEIGPDQRHHLLDGEVANWPE